MQDKWKRPGPRAGSAANASEEPVGAGLLLGATPNRELLRWAVRGLASKVQQAAGLRASGSQVRRPWVGAMLALGLMAGGCGGPHFDGRNFRDGDVKFRLAPLPSSLRRVEVPGTALAFRDDARRASLAIHGRCGRDAPDVPLRSLTRHLFIHFTEQSLSSTKTFALDGREALSTRLSAKLDGVPKHFHVVVLKKNRCVYDFMEIADFEQDPETLLGIVAGFSSID